MSKNKHLISVVALIAVVVVGIFGTYQLTKEKSSIDLGIVRTAEDVPPEGVEYIDENKIALANTPAQPDELINAAVSAFNIMNAHRANAGLPALAWDQSLAECAMVRASECQRLFSHSRPDGSAWWTVNSNIMYGENLAKLYYTPDSVMNAWMNSPSHKQNILAGDFRTCGIAVYQANGKWYWAQEFGL